MTFVLLCFMFSFSFHFKQLFFDVDVISAVVYLNAVNREELDSYFH